MVHVEQKGYHLNRCLIWGPSEIRLFELLEKVEETFGKVYRVKKDYVGKYKKIYTK